MSARYAKQAKALSASFVRALKPVFLCLAVLILAALPQAAFAQERARMQVQNFRDYGRIVLTFPDRLEMPAYTVDVENGIIIIAFEDEVSLVLPDLSGTLPSFIAAARTDPDDRGIRIGLKDEFKVNSTEAGEQLYIDILRKDWVGIEPGLPREVVEKLSRRAQRAAELAEQQRKAKLARENQPTAVLRVGRHPTFTRLRIEWDIDVEGEFEMSGQTGKISFDWPVPIDLADISTDLPPEILSIEGNVSTSGSTVSFEVPEGVEPRFYAENKQEYVIDFDVANPDDEAIDLATLMAENEIAEQLADGNAGETEMAASEGISVDVPEGGTQSRVKPFIDKVGSTLRVVFPFEQETPAAAFRRGDVVWMIFDTPAAIGEPDESDDFAALASAFSVSPSGGTEIVRMTLATDRLATLGSEGRSWVLSLGDVVLTPSELIELERRQTEQGLFEIEADLERPSKVHEVRDPEVGDILEVVTAYPPARGVVRDLSYVDFSALRSVHGLVVKPLHDGVSVRIEEKSAIVSAERGLIVSSSQGQVGTTEQVAAVERDGFMNLTSLQEQSPLRFIERQETYMSRAASAERRELDAIHLEMARFFLANDMSYESLGVLDLLRSDLTVQELSDDLELTRAAALTLTKRPQEALRTLNSPQIAEMADAQMWRVMAHTDAGNYAAARADALASEAIYTDYPDWVRQDFLFAAVTAALETGDTETASRFLGQITTSGLDLEGLSRFELLSARIDEAAGRFDEALDTLGQVISIDVRPTRVEAIYRTMKILERMGRLDPARAAETLATEVMIWRGDELEADMLQLLAEQYFLTASYREAFETVQMASVAHPDDPSTERMLNQARTEFADLYLNGLADSLEPIDALTLYYDFRNLTPSGARGDEMIRNLARRLVKVDLLEQAGELLRYQIDNRLEGAARAQIAADLAIVHLANRDPEKSLQALRDTRISGLPPALDRQRRILEARALIDAGRDELALDILSSMDGRDADLLRVDAHWRGKRYREAAETIEQLYSSRGNNTQFSQSARLNLVKAAVGYVLDDDKIGLTRLRSKFADQLDDYPEWSMFDFVTGDVKVTSVEFRQIAKEVAGFDSLKAFLNSYSEVYGVEGALAPIKSGLGAGQA